MGLGVARVQDTAPRLTERAYGASVLYRFAVTPEVPSKLKHPPSALDHLRSRLAELEHVRNQSFIHHRISPLAGVYTHIPQDERAHPRSSMLMYTSTAAGRTP